LKPLPATFAAFAVTGLNIPYGIWNGLVNTQFTQLHLGLNIPYGIWNAAKYHGFGSSSGLNIPYGIWNFCNGGSIWLVRCLNIPYGIWNSRRCLARSSAVLLFEHTLWDLKHLWTASTELPDFRFEHTLWDLKLIEDALKKAGRWQFEHTLWDLKLFLFFVSYQSSTVWTYPMGFETA